ncbi:hypothetical protein T440DRAFT_505843 [Plenodomus tracheiphilus IPT5]|uniref:Uncharacterized protein n=1 Tax=Plenodomus tracheiphilus IPT5 TaxID=1408161 RepID=A0A6A7BGN1_9PLEO|nr:hypothetical protein T440DRAFT_505843 [Plenodomus tracheiphilus IPT5]
MGPTDEYTQVDARNIGLDRSNISHEGQIELPDTTTRKTDEEVARDVVRLQHEPESGTSTHSTVEKIKDKKHRAGIKIREKLHMSKASDDLEPSLSSPILANTADEQAHSRLDNANAEGESHKLKDFTHNPIDTIKSKASRQGEHELAANIAAKEIPHGQDVDLVNAASELERARSEKEKMLATQNVSELLKLRQSTYVRWTLDRHVTKVRVLPRDSVKRKPRAAFEHKNPHGEVDVDWKAYGYHLLWFYAQIYGGQYIGYGSDVPTPSKETILPNVERLLVATSPFQELIMTTRRVYRWEHPTETAKYLGIYVTLWYFNLLLPGLMSWLVYIVAERRIHGVSIEDMREDIKHTEDQRQPALSITEFIEKKGDEHWADDILQDLGPWLMIQLADAANFFETTRNFYEWRKPHRTGAALGVLGVGIIITTFLPLWLLVKSLTFSLGFTFFALFPLSVNFPEYRLLVSPTKRFLWNIPTHAEWAIQYVQAEGTRVETTATPAPSALPIRTQIDAAAADDYGFYLAHHDKTAGHLVISTKSVRFVKRHPHAVHFTIPYEHIQKLEKEDRVVKKNVPDKLSRDSGKDLKIVDILGRETLLKDLEQRDEAWSQIVGFSKVNWQVVW